MDWNLFWNDCLQFVITYWRELLSVCSVVCSLLLFFFGRRYRSTIDEIKEDVLEILPNLICKVEEDGNGQRKKNAVLELVKLYIEKNFKFTPNEKLLHFFSLAVENILSTPQKKERS